MNKKEEKYFHHALKVVDKACIGCTHCMKVCPTGAIRVIDGKARIIDNRCIDCGECYKACPVDAIIVEQDDFSEIYNYKARILLLPSVLIGQFPEKIPVTKIYGALKKLGFTHIFEVESTVDYILQGYENIKRNNNQRPLISSFCPAVVRLIQVRFPALTDHIIKVKPPIDMSALYFRQKVLNQGYSGDETGTFYVTPCAAKIATVKSPVGEKESPVTGVINMNFLYNQIQQVLQKNPELNEEEPDHGLISKEGILWSLTRGESIHSSGRSLAIDGIHNVSEFLEKLENEEVEGIDFLELRACDESCAGGILISGNRFLTVERLNKRTINFPSLNELPGKDSQVEDFYLGDIHPRPIEKLDEDISKAIKKMERKRRLMCYLPGFDCAACGAPSCQALAEDIVQGKAGASNCVFLQQVMMDKGTLSIEHANKITERIWGKDRLDKDCSKLGAEDENS